MLFSFLYAMELLVEKPVPKAEPNFANNTDGNKDCKELYPKLCGSQRKLKLLLSHVCGLPP
jgi:hypothetical protein